MSNNKDFKVKNGIQPTVYHEGLGTVVSVSVGYSLAGASYDSVSVSISTGTNQYNDITFNNDGTKLFTADGSLNRIREYSLSTAFDLTTRTYVTLFSVSSQEGTLQSIAFNNDGTKLYVVGLNEDTVFQYTLSTAFDLSTASYDSVSFSIASEETLPTCVRFNNDGTKMYILGNSNDTVFQYTLSTAFDLSTASYDSINFVASAQDTTLGAVAFNSDGTIMYILGSLNDSVYQYSLSTAFDVGTASYDSISFSVGVQDSSPQAIAFNNDGSKMFLLGYSTKTIYQYSTALTTKTLDLSTGSVFEVTPTSDIHQVTLSNPAASGTVSGATLLLDGVALVTYDLTNAVYDSVSFNPSSQDSATAGLAFNNDGTKMYMVGVTTDTVYQYSLSTAFDVSTASYDSVSFSVASQDTTPRDMTFNSDGTKMYIVGSVNDTVFQYTLSTAFDLSTASYDSVSFNPSSQDASPNDIAFNNSGTKMYIVGILTDTVYQYSLSTAFDVSTASYDSVSFSVASQDGTPYALTFNNDGTKMYIVGGTNDTVYQYTLSTAFDLSTASYDSVSFSVASQDTTPYSIDFNNVGTKMYILGIGTDNIYQYSTATPATITYDTAIEWPGGTAPTSPAIGETDVVTFNTRDGGSTYQGVLAIDGAQ